MKGIKWLVGVLLVLVMLGSVVSPAMAASTAKMKPITTTERTELHKNINIIKLTQLSKTQLLTG